MPAAEAVATIVVPSRDVLTGILREGAQRMLAQAIDAEVETWIEQHANWKDQQGHQQVVRNGHHPRRTLRQRRTKGNGSRVACRAMVFKLCESAAKTWRLLNGAALLPDVIAGTPFIDGEKAEKDAA